MPRFKVQITTGWFIVLRNVSNIENYRKHNYNIRSLTFTIDEKVFSIGNLEIR